MLCLKPLSRVLRRLFSVLAFGLVAGQLSIASAQVDTRVETGELSPGDGRLKSGEYFDLYEFEGTEGQHVIINLASDEFDTFVQLHVADEQGNPDSAREWHNDDFEESDSRSQIELTLTETGPFVVYVTSYAANETGRYKLKITTESSRRVESGKLSSSDERLDTGEYFEVYEFTAAEGETWVLDMYSDDFDTYLYVRCPQDSDFKLDNDDHLRTSDRSQIVMTAPQDGEYLAYVTSYKPGETGAYRLTFSNTPAAALTDDGVRRETGHLEGDDNTLNSGEYVDGYTFEGVPGQHVRIELTSNDFDTYVSLIDPLDNALANDDFEEETGRSVIETDLTELGTYTIAVTSYKAGETGAYELTIETTETTEMAPAAPADAVADTETAPDRPSSGAGEHLEGSRIITARLEEGDELNADGRYSHVYDFDATSGDRLMVEMISSAFDTVLTLTFPDGRTDRFDDSSPTDTTSRMDLELEQTGRYRLEATSYVLVAGDYTLDFTLGDSDSDIAPPAPSIPVVAGRRIFGIFVGIADYPGKEGDLMYTDDDARSLYNLFIEQYQMRPSDSALLVNEDATIENVMNAVRRIGGEAGPDDLFVFFYSGHGGRCEGQSTPLDANGVHEVIAAYDGNILDEDLASAINASAARLCLVAFDSCFSGGFNKNVCSANGRLGLCSSAEDVTSNVAYKFRAGGYLSLFLAEALGEQRHTADLDHNQELTAREICLYIHDRYDVVVRSTKSLSYISSSENLSYQKFQDDFSAIDGNQVFFRW